MEYISERIKCVDASGIRKIWQMAARMTDPVNFSIGEPDFPAPEAVKAAAVEAINADKNGYTLTTGIDSLRDVLTQLITNQFDWLNPYILITCGVSGALQLSFMATINPGDEVLIPDPYFVIYRHMVNLLGGKCVCIDTYPDFKLDAWTIEENITPKTKFLIINSPSNPSGTVYSSEELQAVATVARKHNLLILSDEIYCDFSYDGPAFSIAQYYENTIIMRGFSKAYGIPGWRLGYMAVPEHLGDLFDRMVALQQYTFVCAPHPFQIAAVTALQCDISPQIAAYRKKRDLIYNGLKDTFGLVRPEGAFYAFVPAPGGNATEFVMAAIKNNVLIIPGSVFSERDSHFRISYATEDERIQTGIDRLCALVEKGW
ncbi:MAG: aminotransferase class I/II-fold pyridoxal phosphate-dependent enzyme [Sedimentisphaerales bacterium]|nr:aminotransferase class I/II-fold pyridoxal phosphate-dependent enzyme [Sedimentisphaerales bacterium]